MIRSLEYAAVHADGGAMTKNQRQERILLLLATGGRMSVSSLAGRLDASDATVRRDVQELAAAGMVERVHGSVLRAAGRSAERPFGLRLEQAGVQKDEIAAAAAQLVQDGHAITLDGGSTVPRMIEHLESRRNLTIVTSNLRTAWEVSSAHTLQSSRLIVAGGVVRPDELSMNGAETSAQLQTMRVDVAFIGVAGVGVPSGFTDFNLEDAQVKRVMVSVALRRVVLADHTKIGQQRFAHVAAFDEINTLITDSLADRRLLRQIESAGVDVIVAPKGVKRG